MSTATISGYHIYYGFLSGLSNIARYREYLNKINVFPVADGDTGNNMIHTLQSIAENIECRRSATAVLDQIADESLRSAHGNSGLIVAQYLNGLAKKTNDKEFLTFQEFCTIASQSVDDAYHAMEEPVEGTMLTVMRTWADKMLEDCQKDTPIKSVFASAFKVVKKALEKTSDQLKVLKDNKVVDAGAWGFVSFIEGLQNLIEEGPIALSTRKQIQTQQDDKNMPPALKVSQDFGDLTYRYCLETLVDSKNQNTDEIKATMKEMGNSLVISQGKSSFRLHIHTNAPQNVVRSIRSYGRIMDQKVDDMVRQEQVVNRRLGKIAVLTDSTADLNPKMADELQIHVLNLSLMWDDETYLDRLTITPEIFYEMQKERRSFPGSSAPTKAHADYMISYLMDHYEGVIVLPISKAMSATWQQFNLAAEDYNKEKQKVAVVDTRTNSAAHGLLVQHIAKSALEGKNLDELVKTAEEMRRKMTIFIGLETLKYMVRGGRVKATAGLVAKALNVKPLISIDENGTGFVTEKAFSDKGLMKKLKENIMEVNEKYGVERYAIIHAVAPDKAEELKEIAEAITGKSPDYITKLSPIVGMHSGRGAVGLALQCKEPVFG